MNVRLNLATKPLISHRRFLVGSGLLALLGGIVFLGLGWHVYSTLRAQEVLRRCRCDQPSGDAGDHHARTSANTSSGSPYRTSRQAFR